MLKLWLTSLTVLMLNFSFGCTINKTSNEKGTLRLVANGEDLVRQGLLSKDGWKIDFNHVNVTLANVKAYQTNAPLNPEQDKEINASETVVLLDTPKTVDLAAGDQEAAPILVQRVPVAAGVYNALSWKVTHLILDGRAEKEGKTIDFMLELNPELKYICGEYVGEERKGILKANGEAEVEMTFHFDHIFGDGNMAAQESINTESLGFQPLAALGSNGTLKVDMLALKQKLRQSHYQTLSSAIEGLGHVGEGHCQVQ
ncbi:MAG: DUF4382 domain-containing protein [Prochloron sp. SP5CPC1]|nr:DUF4382 domain-containing protein [Candidatus Paraprochloron terpiosi SP5CPC1]